MPIKKFITPLAKITLYIKMAFKLLARLDTQSPNILTPLSMTGFKVFNKSSLKKLLDSKKLRAESTYPSKEDRKVWMEEIICGIRMEKNINNMMIPINNAPKEAITFFVRGFSFVFSNQLYSIIFLSGFNKKAIPIP